MKVILTKSQFPKEFYQFFDVADLDAFYDEDIISALYGKHWKTVLIFEDGNAFFNLFQENLIPSTKKFDIEPIFGYFGPLVTSINNLFIIRALKEYRDVLNELDIIAELIRFNPILLNHIKFLNQDLIEIQRAKSIIYVPCAIEDKILFKNYSTLRIRTVKFAQKNNYIFKELTSDKQWLDFQSLYYRTMRRVNSNNRWLFDNNFFIRNKNCNNIKLFAVYTNGNLISSAILLFHKNISYYFLAANEDEFIKGTNDFLIHNMIKYCAERNCKYLCLGGGATNDEYDSLLEYKKKFNKSEEGIMDFFIGKFIINDAILANLNNNAIRFNASLGQNKILLKYRCIS